MRIRRGSVERRSVGGDSAGEAAIYESPGSVSAIEYGKWVEDADGWMDLDDSGVGLVEDSDGWLQLASESAGVTVRTSITGDNVLVY